MAGMQAAPPLPVSIRAAQAPPVNELGMAFQAPAQGTCVSCGGDRGASSLLPLLWR